jgi:hypothetical protein
LKTGTIERGIMPKKVKKKVSAKKATKPKKAPAKKAPAKSAKKVAKVKKKKTSAKKIKAKASKKTTKAKVQKKTTKKKVSAKKVTVKAKKIPTKNKIEKPKEPKKIVPVKVKNTEQLAPEVKVEKPLAPAKAETSAASRITIEHDIILTDAEGRVLCRIRECDQPSVVESYCRYHYLLYWKKIQIRKKILSEGKLEKYIEELTARYPNKYLDLIKKDLSTEGGFLHAIQELEIDESSDEEDARDYDEERSFIEEVRGVSDSNERDEGDY